MRKTKFVALALTLAILIVTLAGCGTAEKPEEQVVDPTPTETTAPEETAAEGYEEGISAADDIVNTTAADKVILVVSFGTSYNESRSLTIGGIEAAVREAYPDYQVRRAFTSQIIIDKLAARDNLNIDNVDQAMTRMVLDGVKEVIIQPTHIMNGMEYDDVIAEIAPYADKFDSIKVGEPLLISDSDFAEVAQVLVSVTEEYRADDTAIVYMGHGTEHAAGAAYEKIQNVLTEGGYTDYIVGTVEHGIDLDTVRAMLADMGAKKVVLRPLMVVAGDHAVNDMAGDEEDSWKVVLENDGYEVITVLEGLGQVSEIQKIYISHIENAQPFVGDGQTSAAAATELTAARLVNGTYPITVESDTSMYKIVECMLTVEDDSMSAVMTLSGQGYAKVYMGTAEAALTEDESAFSNFTDNGERHSFVVPVEALDKELDSAAYSSKKSVWYDHVIVFKADSLPAEAFAACEIDVTMTGGSGKTSIASPAQLTYNGGDMARIVFSSSNYIYMIVDGVEYQAISNEDGSVFEIPVQLDTDMTVIGCTVAMGDPKEIEYVLHFDSQSIR